MREHWSVVAAALWGGRWRRLAFGCAMALGLGFVLAACQTGNLDLKVNTTHDGHDAHPGDGVCAMTPGHHDCSLRAALEEGNASTTSTPRIVVAPGRYMLTDGSLVSDPASGSSALTSSGRGAEIVATGAPSGLDATGGTTVMSGIAVTGASGAGFQVSSGASLVVTTGSSHGNGTGLVVEHGGNAATGEMTLSDNSGAGLDDEGTFGGVFTTITANGSGGVIGSGTTSLQATIVADQASGADCAGPISSQGFNLDSDGTCGLSQSSDLSSHPARLGALSSGRLPVHAPRIGSPAVNVIPGGVGPCTPGPGFLDQRGNPRLVGRGCDRGAVEASFAPLTVTVNSISDDDGSDDIHPGDGHCVSGLGVCTFRAAIEETNAYPSSGDTIDIQVGSGFLDRFEFGSFDIGDPVTIHGNGASVGGADFQDRGLVIDAPTTIDHLTITFGFTHFEGAGIFATAPLTLDHVSVTGNRMIDAGAGGILTSADLTVIDSTISGNSSGGPGGAMVVTGGNTTIVDSTISGNGSNSSDIHGLEAEVIDLAGASATITGTTISDNNSLMDTGTGAGGLLLDTPTATVTNSTISGNSTGTTPELDVVSGVGVVVRSGSARFVDDTIADNTGQFDHETSQPTGPTIEAEGSLTLVGTIVSALPGLACSAPLAPSGGYNIVSDTTCGLTGAGDQQGTDALLGALAGNGGPTQTQLPGLGSPAIDAVPVGTAGLCDGTIATDQRGVARPTGPACDIGSVEQ